MTEGIETLLHEERRYPPSAEFAAQANAQPGIYDIPFEEFWAREARERVTWFDDFHTVLEWEAPYAKWFLGGTLNVCFNCLDRHVEAGQGEKVAFYFEGEPEDDRAPLTYQALLDEVVRVANGLKALGVKKGTPVGIYMGMGPGLPVAMLACARLGAPHTVVFGGFSADSLAGRLNDMECEVLITQDEGWRRGQTRAAQGERRRGARVVPDGEDGRRRPAHDGASVPMVEGRDITWRELTDGQSCRPGHVPVRADGRRGPALPPLHERHDREAEGHRAHDRRLPRRRRRHAPLHLRPQAPRRTSTGAPPTSAG